MFLGEEYLVSSYGSANGATRSPTLDAAVVRNWELSDEESPSKSPVNNNNTEKVSLCLLTYAKKKVK